MCVSVSADRADPFLAQVVFRLHRCSRGGPLFPTPMPSWKGGGASVGAGTAARVVAHDSRDLFLCTRSTEAALPNTKKSTLSNNKAEKEEATFMCVCGRGDKRCIYIYIYISRDRDRESERRETRMHRRGPQTTVHVRGQHAHTHTQVHIHATCIHTSRRDRSSPSRGKRIHVRAPKKKKWKRASDSEGRREEDPKHGRKLQSIYKSETLKK